MNRTPRIAILAAAVLVLLAVGSALANRTPAAPSQPGQLASSQEPEAQDEADTPPTAEELAHAAERLEASGIAVDDAVLGDLAGRYGLGGAVRVLAWSDELAMGVEEIAAMRDGTDAEPGMGWGRSPTSSACIRASAPSWATATARTMRPASSRTSPRNSGPRSPRVRPARPLIAGSSAAGLPPPGSGSQTASAAAGRRATAP